MEMVAPLLERDQAAAKPVTKNKPKRKVQTNEDKEDIKAAEDAIREMHAKGGESDSFGRGPGFARAWSDPMIERIEETPLTEEEKAAAMKAQGERARALLHDPDANSQKWWRAAYAHPEEARRTALYPLMALENPAKAIEMEQMYLRGEISNYGKHPGTHRGSDPMAMDALIHENMIAYALSRLPHPPMIATAWALWRTANQTPNRETMAAFSNYEDEVRKYADRFRNIDGRSEYIRIDSLRWAIWSSSVGQTMHNIIGAFDKDITPAILEDLLAICKDAYAATNP